MSGEILRPDLQVGVRLGKGGVIAAPPIPKCKIPLVTLPENSTGTKTDHVVTDILVLLPDDVLPPCADAVDWSYRLLTCDAYTTAPAPPPTITYESLGSQLHVHYEAPRSIDLFGWRVLLRPRVRVPAWGLVEVGATNILFARYCAPNPLDAFYPTFYGYDFPSGTTFACGTVTILPFSFTAPPPDHFTVDCQNAEFIITPLTADALAMPFPLINRVGFLDMVMVLDTTTATGDLRFSVEAQYNGRPFAPPFTVAASC